MNDIAKSARVLFAYRSLGVRVAIDNFCIAHQAMATGQELAIESVIMGRSLISHVNRTPTIAAFIHSLALLAHNLKLSP